MPKQVIRTNLREHPAVEAWRELRPERVEPDEIAILRQSKKTNTGVYRLTGVGPAGSPVIAKRRWRAAMLIERTVYEEFIPQIPVTSVRYHGFVEERDGEFCWLFLEDAGKEKYSPLSEEQRALAARWLGLMHTSAAHSPAAARLPDRGPSWYLEHLRSAREKILRNRTNPALNAGELVILEGILSQCDLVESRWRDLERCCEGVPSTLVHGDFVPKNVRVRTSQTGIALLPFDWGESGWAVPAADLVRVDAAAYWSVVRDHWPSLDSRTIGRLVNVGKIFRALAALNWESMRLAKPWRNRQVRNLVPYQAMMADAIQEAPWGD